LGSLDEMLLRGGYPALYSGAVEPGDQKRDLAPRRRGAEGKNTKIVCFGFYSRGFAAFAGKTNAGGDAHPP